jgi:lipopolysaccharide transport system ATP-binding protein
MVAMQSLCDRAIWLDQGRIVLDGSPGEVSSRYLEISNGLVTEQLWEDTTTAPGNDQVRLRRAAIHPAGGEPSDMTTVHTPIELEFDFWNLVPHAQLHLSIVVFNEEGAVLFCSTPFHEPVWFGRPMPQGLFRSACAIPGDLLNNGPHRVTLHVIENGTHEIYRHDGILNFEVHDDVSLREHWFGKWGGALRPNLEWRTARIDAADVPQSEMPPELPARCPEVPI